MVKMFWDKLQRQAGVKYVIWVLVGDKDGTVKLFVDKCDSDKLFGEGDGTGSPFVENNGTGKFGHRNGTRKLFGQKDGAQKLFGHKDAEQTFYFPILLQTDWKTLNVAAMPCRMLKISPNGKEPNIPRKNGSCKLHSLEEEVALMEKLQINPGDLLAISKYVQENKEKLISFTLNLCLRICDLNGTEYMGQTYMLESWQNLYLPQKTRMEVLGAVDNYHGLQLVILVAEDGRVFTYEEEQLKLIASSLPDLVQNGVNNNGEVYRYPHDLSDEDEETLQNNEEIRTIRKRTREFVNESAGTLEEILNFF
ncbi:uncharacterized protein RCH25_048994 [Pelodytes ibericus]